MKTYQKIAQIFDAMLNCQKSGNKEWEEKHRKTIEAIVKTYLPHGSGIDSGVTFDFDSSNPNKLVFLASFHHMDENGYYDGWTDHKIILRPSLANGYHIHITGFNKNDIKDYLSDIFSSCFDMEFEQQKTNLS